MVWSNDARDCLLKEQPEGGTFFSWQPKLPHASVCCTFHCHCESLRDLKPLVVTQLLSYFPTGFPEKNSQATALSKAEPALKQRQTAIMSDADSLTNCRFYEEKYPEIESFVMVNVKQVCGVPLVGDSSTLLTLTQ